MSSFASSISGLNAASWLVSVASRNIANLNSVDYRAKQAGFAANLDGSVQIQALAESGAELSPGGSNVDLATEMVSLMVGSIFFKANMTAIRTQQEILGMAMDLKA
jgi:flagellar hook protein FlgE